MPRVILVSNRVTDIKTAKQAGGVSVALADIMTNHDTVWFGWNGEIVDDAEGQITEDSFGDSKVATVPLTAAEHTDFYLGYSNSVLWPVFHNRLDLAKFEAGYYPAYIGVNRRFAAALQDFIRPDDLIWIHDYQLVPMAAELRQLGVNNVIGFFLHIPIPPAQAFLAIPEYRELAGALAAYDLIGLQTQQDVANLIDFFHQSVFGQLLPDGRMRVVDKIVQIASFPIGINCDEFFEETPRDASDQVAPAEIRIIGIDRLDYTKGLPQKFRAYARFLDNHPAYRRRVVLSQIAPPTREELDAYSDIRSELESLAGSINGKFGELDWVPINYMHRPVGRADLFAIYRGARVALVTPLRDGMNLVCKEYVAAQDSDDPGVLVLSRFAGAAEQLESAIIVNPYNIDEVANALCRALEMPAKERRMRHARLLKEVSAHSSADWGSSFICRLTAIAHRIKSHQEDFVTGTPQHLLDTLHLRLAAKNI